jgi:hypothetical protein
MIQGTGWGERVGGGMNGQRGGHGLRFKRQSR